MTNNMRISLIANTSHSIYPTLVLCGLIRDGVTIDSVFCARELTKKEIFKDRLSKLIIFKKNAWYYSREYFKWAKYRDHSIPQICQQEHIRYFNSKDITNKIGGVDLIIYCGGLGVVKKDILSIPKIGVMGIHTGKLPEYKGHDCLGWSALKGEEPEITAFFLDEGIDTGDILSYKKIDLNLVTDYWSTIALAEVCSATLICDCVTGLRQNSIQRIKQEKGGNIYPRFKAFDIKRFNSSLLHRPCKASAHFRTLDITADGR